MKPGWYRTRNGRTVQVLETKPKDYHPVEACEDYTNPKEWVVAHVRFAGGTHGGLYCYHTDGRSFDTIDRSLDIVIVRAKQERTT